MRAWWRVVPLAAAIGCGYAFSTPGARLPPDTETISIALFENHTRERGLEVELRRALEEEFRRRGGLRVVPEPGGDVVVDGSIRRIGDTPVASRGSDEAVALQQRISVSVRLVQRATGQVVMRAPRVIEVTEFGVEPGAIITTSPRFQSEPVDARDIANLSNVPLGEGRRATAQRDLLQKLAADIYSATMEGF
ncbi:MAG TPA: LptE family protein [Candidatus Limnocylindria bacterium]|nr:LptE family protein [Candidatus Limnocylindria bacterium]